MMEQKKKEVFHKKEESYERKKKAIGGFVEAKKHRQKRILSGLFVENSKLMSLSFHFLLKTQTREF
jgi:hypothetical protein